MSVTGGIKFFYKSMCLFAEGSTISATTGNTSAPRALDKNPVTHWRSSGSADSITETIIVTFSELRTINRIFLVDHNWKQYTVKYDLLGVYTNFSNVITINGSTQSNISETTYSNDTSYYEFDSLSTNSIQITVTKTQVADDEKYISQIVATLELGTLVGYPIVNSLTHSRNQRVTKMLSGKDSVQKSEESIDFRLDFKNYPSSYSEDINLMLVTLYEMEDSFLVWICGGRNGTNYFRHQLKGFRLKDLYLMQYDKDIDVSYSDNIYISTVNFRISLTESV